MNIQKFTQKSVEAIQNAQSIAVQNQNPQIEEEHLLLALLEQNSSLIKELLKKMGIPQTFENTLKNEINKKPKVTGGARPSDSIYISQEVEIVLANSEKLADKMQDEYVSVEHIMLSLIDNANSNLNDLFRKYNITKNEFLKALSSVRGNTRVTTDNPEETYNVLKKYGQDLVKLAKEQKLDPVIGRDTEIRNVIRILSRKTKNNPCLIGEPGVGKTAIAEGLALRIVRGDVPEGLKECTIFSLDMGLLIAGTNIELEKDIEEKSKIDEMRKQFISDVSHELKTPIALIQGYAEGLVENVNTDDESRKFYAEVILDESNKMDILVKQLLELMKLEYGKREFNNKKFNITELITEVIRRCNVMIQENNIQIKYDNSKELCVYADDFYIEQVITNYLTNAIKHAKEINGVKKITINTEVKENKVRVSVYNTGDNISQEDLDRIWGRFYKVDSSRNRNSGGTRNRSCAS